MSENRISVFIATFFFLVLFWNLCLLCDGNFFLHLPARGLVDLHFSACPLLCGEVTWCALKCFCFVFLFPMFYALFAACLAFDQFCRKLTSKWEGFRLNFKMINVEKMACCHKFEVLSYCISVCFSLWGSAAICNAAIIEVK